MPRTHSGERVIKPLNQLHSPIQEVLIGGSLPCPTFQDLVDSIPLFAAEFAVRQIRVVNDLRNDLYSPFANPEVLRYCLERPVVAAVPEAPLVKHVQLHRYGRNFFFRRTSE